MTYRPTLMQVSNGESFFCPGCGSLTSIDKTFAVGQHNLRIVISCDKCGEEIYSGPSDPDVRIGGRDGDLPTEDLYPELKSTLDLEADEIPTISGNDLQFNSLQWQGPEDDRTKAYKNFLYGQTYKGDIEVDDPPDWLRSEFLQWTEGMDLDGEDLPGEPTQPETCPVCEESFYEDEEDWVERDGVMYCSVDCLNEAVHL